MFKKDNKGFTIIEVLIVLAIAGLILLIVFLAVPALQRNSRNNARTNDAARIGAAVNDWVANNQGKTFTAGTSNANLIAVNTAAGTLAQFSLTPGTNFTVATGAQTALSTDAMRVVTSATCGDNGATVANSNSRLAALQYVRESGSGGFIGACTNL